MNNNKIQEIINLIKYDIKVNKKNIITINKEYFGNKKKQEISFTEGQIYEATHIIKLLEKLK